MPLYFAYGSNMLPRQMFARCPGSQAVGRAMLAGWRFHITAKGTANIRASAGAAVHGVLWRLEERHLTMLDRWEGVRLGHYQRRRVSVAAPCGREHRAVAYISTRSYEGVGRADYMLSAVIPGARAFDLPAAFIEELTAWLPSRPIAGTARRYHGRRH